jgi:hypothetical protein
LVFQRKTPRPTVNFRADFRIEFGAAVESLLNAVSNVQGVLLCHPVARIIWRYSSRCSYAGVDFRQYSINEFGEQPAHAPVGIARAAICGLAGFAASYAHSLEFHQSSTRDRFRILLPAVILARTCNARSASPLSELPIGNAGNLWS